MKLDLNDRDRICFFGDSITHHGWWISEIYQYFTDNYPELNTMFFNCGVAGTRAKSANQKDRMYCDLFNFFPKYGGVVVSFAPYISNVGILIFFATGMLEVLIVFFKIFRII